jgi:hypothetical protein
MKDGQSQRVEDDGVKGRRLKRRAPVRGFLICHYSKEAPSLEDNRSWKNPVAKFE